MSVNKSQGQENEAVLLDLRNQLFSHGHLYVALSRVREASKIAIFTKEEYTLLGPDNKLIAIATNLVYPELLEPVGIRQLEDDSDTVEGFERRQASVQSTSITGVYGYTTVDEALNDLSINED